MKPSKSKNLSELELKRTASQQKSRYSKNPSQSKYISIEDETRSKMSETRLKIRNLLSNSDRLLPEVKLNTI